MTKRFGFTLAEVLITLGIIGVVAAMTMPTLMNQTNGAQYKAAYKKALSAISQGVTLNVALDGGSFADTTVASGGKTDVAGSVAKLLNDRMNIVKVASEPDVAPTLPTGNGVGLPEVDTVLYFNDGSMFAFGANAHNCTIDTESGATGNVCEGYIDVNGSKGPNKVVSCKTPSDTAKDTWKSNETTKKYEKTDAAACEVGNPTDVYPVFFYDQTITPATNAAKAVLYGK